MRYRIEYVDGKCCNYANSREDLLEWLKLLHEETITDIRKVYKNGVTDSVMEKYQRFIKNGIRRSRSRPVTYRAVFAF